MKAAVLEGVRNLLIKEVPTPRPKADQVLLRVRACGICLTDYKAYSGERTNVVFPTILGHEFAGVVEEVGDQVKYFHLGDEVAVLPVISCGVCRDCRNGFPHYCRYGAVIGGDGMDTVLDGAFAEYVLVPERTLYHKPKDVSFKSAALTEPLAGSYKGLIEYSQMKIGEDVVIIGAGGMGLLATMIAHRAGAGNLILIDIDEWRLNFGQKLGATHLINSQKTDPIKEVYRILPQGPDLVFEAAGSLAAADLAFKLCRRGTRVNEFGVTTDGTVPISPRAVHFNETRVDASFSVTPRVMQASLRLMEKGLVDPSLIITHTFPLEKIEEAMKMIEQPERVKVMIVFND